MSDKIDDSTHEIELQLQTPVATHHRIYLYVLRSTTIDDKFKIRAYINNDIKHTFSRMESIVPKEHNKEMNVPYIYRVEIEVVLDKNGRLLYWNREQNGGLVFQNYRLRLSRKIPNTDTTFRDYHDEKIRYIQIPLSSGRYFLFDVVFARNIVDAPPGYDVPLWDQLYIYTFYIIRYQMYDAFDALIDQFRQTIPQNRLNLSLEEFNDFFQNCLTYLEYALGNSPDPDIANKILISMMGLLPITKRNFSLHNPSTLHFTTAILDDVKEHYDHIFATIKDNEWDLFRNGLVLYLSIELLSQSKDTINIIHRMKNKECKKDLANVLLKRLEELDRPILGLNWTDLFTLVDPNILTLKQIGLTKSIETYITSLVQIVAVNRNEQELADGINRNFDDRIYDDRLPINLENIIYLLKFLQLEPSETEEEQKNILKLINSVIESSIELRKKIKDYLYRLKVNIEQFKDIQFILSYLSKSIILYNVQKRDLLISLMVSANESYSYEFFKQWFYAFLIFDEEINEINKKDFQDLLQHWTTNFSKFPDITVQILMDIDVLIDAFKKPQYQTIFINLMVNFCFRPESFYRNLSEGLLNVHNDLFIEQFKKHFSLTSLNIHPDRLKQLANPENPLYHFINIHKQIQDKSQLINQLIQLTTNKIQFNTDEILRDTFEKPTRTTCIYAILFDDCFKTCTLRQTIIDQLLAVWNTWEERGFRANEILGWKKFTHDERQIVNRIWAFVSQIAQKQFQIDQLIAKQEREMDEKLLIKEKITKCLEIYCQNASDKQLYIDLLAELDTNLRYQIVRTVMIPLEIKVLLPMADRLNSLEKLYAWKRFLVENRKYNQTNSSATTDPDSPDIIDDDDTLLSDDNNPGSDTHPTTVDSNRNLFIDKRPCIEILKENMLILNMFINRLKTISSECTKLPISNVLELFLDIQYVDHDFEILKPLLQLNDIKHMKGVLDYWKNRDFITHVCQGFLNLLENLNKTSDATYLSVKGIPTLTSQTEGLQCYMYYQKYLTIFERKYSKDLLNFLSQYSLSKDLIRFLNRLPSTDVDNLLQAVNDWDETLINTKTVLDFVMLKRFFVRFNQEIELMKSQPFASSLDDIEAAFTKTFQDEQFKNNLFNCFETCSSSLTTIERIHLELTDKKLSKRNRISDIMQNITFYFVKQSNKFNIDIQPQSISINDLSELRDRARLIEYSRNCNQFSMDTERDLKELHSFVTFVEIVEKVLRNFSLLYIAGHPSIVNYLLPNNFFTCINSNYQQLIDFSLMLDDLHYNWEIHLCQMYEKHLDLTYFSYEQIWIIENYLYNCLKTGDKKDFGYHLLKYIGIEPETIKSEYLPIRSENPNERLENIGRILTAQRTKTNLTFKQENQNIKKVYLAETSDEGILRAILSLFKHLHITISVEHLFYCNEETSWMEIRAFTYRCFYSQTLHQLIRPELLSASVQDHFTRLLRQLIDQNPQHYFRLGIITTVSNTHLQLINGLRTLQIVHTIHDQDMLNRDDLQTIIKEFINDNSILVTSRLNGLGKTHLIKNEIKGKNLKYIKFPISGDIDVDIIGQRLCSYGNDLTAGALHIDIGAINHIKQLNEILYCLVLFRSYRFRQVAVSIPNHVPIYIELDSSPYSNNLHDKITLFEYMTRKSINHIDWNQFEIINPSVIQLVVNYFQAMKNQTILTQNITANNLINYEKTACIDLLKEPFLKDKNLDSTNWTQLSIFISVYYSLYSGFSRCGYFLVGEIANAQLRYDILQSLLQSSNQFTSLCVENVRKNQRSVNQNEAMIAFSDAIVRWDKTQPFTIVFSATDDPIFVYKNPKNVPPSLVQAYQLHYEALTGQKDMALGHIFPDYTKFTHAQFFQKLALLSKKYFNKSICVKCYSQYEFQQKQCTTCETNEILYRPISFDTQHIEKFQEFIAEKIRSQYVLTPDNYIKMLLIYLRVQSGLPVLIMGETGCGKTALIQFLCQKILDDEMEVFRIHAGVTSEQIINQMKGYAEKADIAALENKRLWIFFDEFNTTPNIGLIKEITCERTLLGQPLPYNMVLLGACNPQRRKKENKIVDNNIGIRKDLYEMERLKDNLGVSLLYTVVPIPETMLEYVWDYGYLDNDIETKYIKTMLNTCEQLASDVLWFDHIVKAISCSQKFFRELEDVSSVSLRDVARFCRLYNWFRKSIIDREGEDKFQNNLSPLIRRSSLSALVLCYYFRLNSAGDRKNYTDQIEGVIKPAIKNLSTNFLVKFLDMEQKKLIERMELPKGTAKNRALMDNIFVLLVCIVNRIPVIICGKPGCSKTSAIQIVISNLKGKKSVDPYFQKLPELITVSYQGSQNCTSESIIKVFQRADKYLNVKSSTDILPVIVFDEIGLAELSPHNPLKVLHSKLEVETCQYGFVGLSNWRLDASKMNRTLYLSCPDPDKEDLKLTAQTISDSLIPSQGQLNRIDRSVIEALAIAYYDLYCVLETDQDRQKYRNYFGLRDFYSLIKGVVNDLIKCDNELDSYEYILRQLIINFDGMLDGSQFMWKRFCENINRKHLIEQYKSPTFKQLLDQRLVSRHGRYLMLIADNESVIDYVERYIIVKHQPPSVRTLIGSCFSGDLISGRTYTEQYNYRVLMDIILYAESNVTLIMRRMGHLYDNLYDLFNQNFAVSGKKKYCRIALGALYHPRCLVNDDFYCVVFVRKEDLVKCDPPFLNRFEKHLIDMNSLIHERHRLITDNLLNELLQLIPTNINKYFPLLQHLFVDYSNDYVCNLVIDAFDQLNLSIDDDNNTTEIINYCKNKLIRTSSFDLPLILSLQKDQCHPLIDQYYETHTDLSFQTVIQQALSEKVLTNQVIYTYTQTYHVINYNSDEIEEIMLSTFKTELELTNKIKQHYQKRNNQRLLIIRVDYHQEHEHILPLKHILLNSKIESINRSVWLIFHLQRNMLNQTINEVLFNGWSTLMINDLNEHKLIPKTLLLNPSYIELVTNKYFLLSECMFDELVDRCLTKFRYTVSRKDQITQINIRRNQIIENLTITNQGQSLRSIVQENLLKLIIKIKLNRFQDWRHDLLTNGLLIGTCRSFNDALQQTISIYYENFLLLLFYHLEKYSFIDSFILLNTNNEINHLLNKIWFDCLFSTLQTIDTTIINLDVIEMPLIFNLNLPCASKEYDIIRVIRQIVLERRSDDSNKDELMNFAIKQLRTKSIYGTNIEMIFNEKDLFNYYYYDQLALAQDEAKIYNLSSVFIQRLVMSNPTRSTSDHLKHLLVDYNEFFEILRLFEISTKLIDEKDFLDQLFNQQFIILNENDKKLIKNDSSFYYLVLTSDHYYLIPPKSELSNEHIFECDGDPFIEVSLMNLIEFLLSPSIIDRITNIEQLTTTYSLVAQGIFNLKPYSVNNLEKLRSFISLIRCITTVISTDKALNVFKQACRYALFDATFETSDDIHKFINHLQRIINTNEPNLTESIVQRTLLKLESEFIKNWLIDHGDQYFDIITLMSKPDNNLWIYSAKIFTYIDLKLQLLPMTKDFRGQLPSIDDCQQYDEDLKDLIIEYQQFDEHLKQLNDLSKKIEHIIVTRIHMHFILNINNKERIEDLLDEDFHQFEENLYQLRNPDKQYGTKLISLISWLKYYAQLYALVLINDSHHRILEDLDKLLTRDDFLFCSTMKLFIIKQLCQMSNITLDQLRDIIKNRNITWIRPMIALPTGKKTQETRHSLILPTPLFECREEFLRIDRILTNHINLNDIRQLINQCQKRQDTFYCFIIWFIHYYARFYVNNDISSTNDYQQLIEHDLSKEIIESFELIGYKLLVFLCTNFKQTNYFHIHPQMTLNELHERLLALNLIALLLSYKTLTHHTHLSTLLFDGNLKMPQNYTEHIQSSVCLPGLVSTNPIITQMIDVRTTVKERLDQGQIHEPGKYVFQCSKDCLWMFYFINCGVPVDRSKCPLCNKDIGASAYGILIERDPPQIRMTIDEGFQFINNYIEQYNKVPRFGYHNQTPAIQSNQYEKSDHLNRSISYRFMHMITHTVLLFLNELALLPAFPLKTRTHLREHYEKDYELLCKQSTDYDQCYIWLYKLFNHMINKEFIVKGYMNTNEKVVQLEKLLEEKLIFNHIDSIANEINQYKTAYAEYVRQRNEEATIDDFVNEMVEDENKYPLLNFFNVTNIYTSNPLDEFRIRLQTIPYGDQIYPVTTFLMKRLNNYANIQYLYPIILFTNYLIEKFNHRLKRNDASETLISHYLTHGSDSETINRLYTDFVHAWYKLHLNEVRYGCQTTKFELTCKEEDFARNTKIAMVLLNTTKDDSSILLAACLRTIGELQNEIVHFFHNKIVNDADTNRYRENAIPIQSIQSEHILHIDENLISKKLITDGFTINYQYGKSKDIIYDYEEIELTLRNMIGRLPLIDTEKMRFLNYQFELYSENTSLINDVRKHIKQDSIKENERLKLKNLINSMPNDDILHYLGSLDYVFTYLRNIDEEIVTDSLTIQTFVEQYIRSSACLNDNVLQRPPFATINLKYIIDLYELIEEIAYDKVLRHFIKQELTEEIFPIEQRKALVKQFSDMTYRKSNISPSLQNIHAWISILKRLIVRVLSNVNVSLDVPIQIYLERTDIWTGNITENDIQTFEVPDEILLQHTYVILKGLENENEKNIITNNKQTDFDDQSATSQKNHLQNVDTQSLKVKTWHNDSISNASMMTRVIKSDKTTGKKVRV